MEPWPLCCVCLVWMKALLSFTSALKSLAMFMLGAVVMCAHCGTSVQCTCSVHPETVRDHLQVLPPHVDAESAAKEGWWKDPSFILKELNINSTISSPGHDERIIMDQNRRYTMKGYAYSGGGRKIVRVEVSFNGGGSRS